MTSIHRPRLMKTRALFIAVALMASLGAVAVPPFSTEALAQGSEQIVQKGEQKMKINLTIGSKRLSATLADNATAKDFVSVLPLTVLMNDLLGREKYGDSPKPLSEKGPRKKTYEVGDIAYWSPNHEFAVYYHHDGELIPSPGIIPIAKIDVGAEAFNVPGSMTVTIEIAK